MKSSMMFYNLLAVLLVGAVSGASNMVFKTIDVDMGSVGSDDDIRLKLCDKSKCCTTKVLSNTFSGEWVKNKKEKWDGSKLGNCSQILFDENLSSIEVSLLKDGKKTGPEVNSITLTGQIGSDKKKLKKYKCGSYRLSSRDNVKSNKCSLDTTRSSNSPTSTTSRPNRNQSPSSSGTPNMTFKKLEVQMGNVGSDDDMRVRICDNSKCCTTKELSHTFSSEWVAKKKETWDGSDMGNCSGILFDSKLSSIEVVLLKSGKKSAPEIKSIIATGQVGSNKANLQTYKCGDYKFTKTDNQKSRFCITDSVPSSAPRTPTSTSSGNLFVNQVFVQVGDDGTDDDVSLEVINLSGIS